MNPGYNYHLNYPNNYGERQFVVPFLFGALTGGAAVGLTRPRPIYNVAPYPVYPQYPPRPPYQPMPYYSQTYNYYRPYY